MMGRFLVWVLFFIPSVAFIFSAIAGLLQGDTDLLIGGLIIAFTLYAIGRYISRRLTYKPISDRYYDDDFERRNIVARLFVYLLWLVAFIALVAGVIFLLATVFFTLSESDFGSAIFLGALVWFLSWISRKLLKRIGDLAYKNIASNSTVGASAGPPEERSLGWYLITSLSIVGIVGTPIEMLSLAQHFITIGDFWLGIVGLWDYVIGDRVDQVVTWVGQVLRIPNISEPIKSWLSLGILTSNIYARSLYVTSTMDPRFSNLKDRFPLVLRIATLPLIAIFWPIVILQSIRALRTKSRKPKNSAIAKETLKSPILDSDHDRREKLERMKTDFRRYERIELAQELFIILPFFVGLALLVINFVGMYLS